MSGCSDDYVQAVAAQQDPGDRHVQSHVYELTGRDDFVTIHRVGEAEPAEHYNDWHLADENASDMQEVYEIVDVDVKRFIPPFKEIKTFTVLAKEVQHRRHQILNLCHGHRGPNVRPHARSSFYMVDENPLDGVENIPE